MGFIGYLHRREDQLEDQGEEVVRIFLECREEPHGIFCTYAVDVVFPGGKAPCLLRGVDGILVLKKFYKLVNSLEERAREHGNDRLQALGSVEGLLEHLRYTRNARDLAGVQEPTPSATGNADLA